MKKITSLQVLLLMGLAIYSNSMIAANSSESEHTQTQSNGHPEMKAIESDLHNIKMEFEMNHNAQTANSQLDNIAARISKAVAEMKQSETHGTMWKKHNRTLQAKLTRLRKYIATHSN